MRQSNMGRSISCLAVFLLFFCSARGESRGSGGVVSGRVQMPDVCSPSVSPAVVYLQPAEGRPTALDSASETANSGRFHADSPQVLLVNQRGLQFVPRVQAIALGQAIRFTNEDGETHNVHVVSPGFVFNQSMAPGQFRDFAPAKPGVMRLACDIHMHMRAFVVISPTPWVRVCDREGRYQFDDVPSGRYILTAWHEMGDPVQREITIADTKQANLPDMVLTSSLAPPRMAAGSAAVAPEKPWADVIDRIGVILAASRDAATRPGEAAKARRLADDAYWVEFESSDMETAVNKYLGFAQARKLERQFHAISVASRDVAEKRQPVSMMVGLCHQILLDLTTVATALNAKGVTDRSRIDSVARQLDSRSEAGSLPADLATMPEPSGEPRALVESVKIGLRRVIEMAGRDDRDEAAAELSTVYMTEFEPLERYFSGAARSRSGGWRSSSIRCVAISPPGSRERN